MQQGTRLRFHDFFAALGDFVEGRHDILVLNIALGKHDTVGWLKMKK